VPSGCPLVAGFQSAADVPDPIIAWSLNFTVVGPLGSGFLYAYPTGGTAPPTSIINYNAGDLRNNAAIVPVNATTGSFTVGTSVGTDVIIDTNGIFLATLEISTQLSISASMSAQGAIRGTNSNTTAGSSGVYGLASATTGVLYGVLGQESSTTADSAGLRGVDGTGSPGGSFSPSGVRGESTAGFGVLGTSRFVGIDGVLLNIGGATVADGRLGFSTGGTNYGVYSATGDIGATGTKSFVVPHPTDPSRIIRYISMEGPEAGTYFRGRGRLEGRVAVIDVPESFRLVTEEDGLSIQVTPIGGPASLWIQEVGLDHITVRGPRDLDFFYTVNGVRKGYGAFEPMSEGSEFVPESSTSRLPEGLNPEAKRRLISNGTYNADGTVNMETAERLGWTKLWAARSSSRRVAEQR
jgi:hypothetical protein